MSDLFYKTLLAELSSTLAMRPLTFNAQGECDLVIDERVALKLVCDFVNQRLLIIGLLEVSPDLPLQRLLAGALNPLVSNGPGLGWDTSSELYFAFQALPREKVSVGVLMREIAALVEWINFWRDARE